MSKYKVLMGYTAIKDIIVEADNMDEAENKAYDEVDKIPESKDSFVIDVEELKDE